MEQFTNEKYTVRKLAPNILESIIHNHANLEEEDFWKLNGLTTELNNNKPFFLLVTTGYFTTSSEEFLRLSAEKDKSPLSIARAVVVSSLGHRMAGKFYLKVRKPQSETKLFRNREDAINWLTEISNKNSTITY